MHSLASLVDFSNGTWKEGMPQAGPFGWGTARSGISQRKEPVRGEETTSLRLYRNLKPGTPCYRLNNLYSSALKDPAQLKRPTFEP